ncbi:MAG: hypothetical protein J6C19_15240 [Lachnospiraceae bacterium]|nr:hypothetical protein [Lachnospiraceae bacterium]MBO5146857.1 hypothetical protein [Lachnospiraceae bacterium]
MKKAKSAIIIVILVALVGGYYFYLSNHQKAKEETVVTAVQDVLLRNLDTDYPPTPKEVVRYYSDITKCLYNETYTDEQFEQMADKLLALYDEELAQNNPRDQYLKDLKSDVDDFLKNGYSIVSYTTSMSTDVEEYTYEGRKCANLYCIYSIKSGSEYKSSKQIFVLRKDTESGHWKILGFEVVTQ